MSNEPTKKELEDANVGLIEKLASSEETVAKLDAENDELIGQLESAQKAIAMPKDVPSVGDVMLLFKATPFLSVYNGNKFHAVDGETITVPAELAERMLYNLPENFTAEGDSKITKEVVAKVQAKCAVRAKRNKIATKERDDKMEKYRKENKAFGS